MSFKDKIVMEIHTSKQKNTLNAVIDSNDVIWRTWDQNFALFMGNEKDFP